MTSKNTFKNNNPNLELVNKNSDKSIREKLDLLALDLATNHCTVSFGEKEKKEVKQSEIFGDSYFAFTQNANDKDKTVSEITQHRNILVIGAGATYDSYKCIPLGAHVIEKFNDTYKSKIKDFPAINERFESYLHELKLQNREPDFENILSLYSEHILTPEDLRTEISSLFNFRYSPSLFYEIIAHLFKHSFIDVIINFNFDEILDQAIEEELGKENYYHIISDGDCVPIEDMMVDGRLKIPIYIKPHGTVSHRSTLRFTKRHYLDVPEQIKKLLVQLIEGQRGEVVGMNQKQVEPLKKVNLICVGFNMESLEFGDILNEKLPEQSRIYHFCFEEEFKKRDPLFVSKVLPNFFERAFQFHVIDQVKNWDQHELHKNVYTRISLEKFIKNSPNKLTTPLAETFSYLWRTIFHLFKDDLRPRSIGRHEIISYFFYDPDFTNANSKSEAALNRQKLRNRYEENTEYFLDRTIVEIAMAINRNNGIIDISQLLNDRAGSYYKKYKDCYFNEKKTNIGAHSFYQLINQFTSVEYQRSADTTYSKNIFQLDLNLLEKLQKDELLLSLKNDNLGILSDVNNSMRRWENKVFVMNEHGDPEIKIDQEALITILRKFSEIINPPENNEPVSVMIVYRLFMSKLLSQSFIENFKRNILKQVFNSKDYDKSKYSNDKVHLIDEISRLFLKSSKRHFYSIRPKFHDPKNYLTESFSISKILHTNLSVEYTFRRIFLNVDWDIAFLISETGSMLDFLNNYTLAKKICRNRKIVMLNSFDAIKQLHREVTDIKLINKLHNDKYNHIISDTADKNVIHTFSLPSIQHNHHVMLFIKKIAENETCDNVPSYVVQVKGQENKRLFKLSGAMYVYRQGFSNNLNPILIGINPFNNPEDDLNCLNHDFKKLLRLFSTTFCRALAFEGSVKIKNLNVDLTEYQKWSPDEEVQNINVLLDYLYDIENANFEIEK